MKIHYRNEERQFYLKFTVPQRLCILAYLVKIVGFVLNGIMIDIEEEIRKK